MTRLGLLLIASGVLLALSQGCYPEPEGPECLTPSALTSVSLTCEPLKTHERITLGIYGAPLSDWTVELASETQWSDKYHRAYFTDDELPGWMLWGETSRATHRITLADEELYRSVLAHEECHVHNRYASHAEWPDICNRAEDAVFEAMTPAAGVMLGGYEAVPVSLPDGSVAHGVPEAL